jgi:hypothetical protein
MAEFWVAGIVSQRDKQPYVQLSNEVGLIAQLTMTQARQIAMDMLVQCSRAEMDAMVLAFVEKMDLPPNAGPLMMRDFREFRSAFDNEVLERAEDNRPPYPTEGQDV